MASFFIGQILTTGFNFAPVNTALCNGQLMAISQNVAMFSVIGTFYGGDGVSTFALPNLQGRRMNHQGQLSNGGGSYVIGQQAGVTSVTLTNNNMPTHSHVMTSSLKASTTNASTLAPAAGSVLGAGVDISGNAKLAQPAIYCPAGTATSVALNTLNVSAGLTGGVGGVTQSFSNLDPYLVISMAIVLFGVFPSRN